ncbi:lasso peptide biosynthesis B2 protein [Streptomyces sp. NWU339]|uniref:lasso peptide biosynthesis B2 protein n=1 Tax=Streptomyces sp. NWU339 TaxID=2185284 RepID=UPI00215B1C2F|nr:lasso peptide biosynthesis B2 protein [Streptomyces sp. NWU339]
MSHPSGRLLADLTPRRIRAVLGSVRRGTRPARYEEALRARREVTVVSTLCADRCCLRRSPATTLVCRMPGRRPTHRVVIKVQAAGETLADASSGAPVRYQ